MADFTKTFRRPSYQPRTPTALSIASPTGQVILSPPLLDEADTFFAPTVTFGPILPPLYTDADTFPAPIVSNLNTLLPGLLSEADVFPAASVFNGTTLVPPLVDETDIFPSPTVSTAAQQLSPPLVDEADAFPAATIQIPIYPTTLASEEAFFSPAAIITRQMNAGLYVDPDTFYAPNVQRQIDPPAFAGAAVFHAPLLTAKNTLSPSLVTDPDNVISPVVLGGVQLLNVGVTLGNVGVVYPPAIIRTGFNRTYARNDGSYRVQPYWAAKYSGEWLEVQEVWVKREGAWSQVYAASD